MRAWWERLWDDPDAWAAQMTAIKRGLVLGLSQVSALLVLEGPWDTRRTVASIVTVLLAMLGGSIAAGQGNDKLERKVNTVEVKQAMTQRDVKTVAETTGVPLPSAPPPPPTQ